MNQKHILLVRKILSLNELALGIALAFVALRMVFILRQVSGTLLPYSAVAAPSLFAGQPVAKSQPTTSDYAAIFEKNIFGGSTVKFEPGGNMYEAMPSAEEQLGLSLSGTIAGSRSVARAIIKDLKTNMFGLYKIGDTVGRATIEQIEKNSVILIHDSQRKVLKLYAKGTGPRSMGSTQPNQPVVYKQEVSEIETNAPGEPEAKTLSRLGNIETVLKTATIEPNEAGGKVEGLKIMNLGNSQKIATELGLKDGDIIQAVNDQKLTNTQMAYQVLKKARSQSTITVKLIRDGKSETLSFPLR
jgi:type II secretion system protein C